MSRCLDTVLSNNRLQKLLTQVCMKTRNDGLCPCVTIIHTLLLLLRVYCTTMGAIWWIWLNNWRISEIRNLLLIGTNLYLSKMLDVLPPCLGDLSKIRQDYEVTPMRQISTTVWLLLACLGDQSCNHNQNVYGRSIMT